MRWPWQKQVEKRESAPFTDAVVAAIEAQAGGQRPAIRAQSQHSRPPPDSMRGPSQRRPSNRNPPAVLSRHRSWRWWGGI